MENSMYKKKTALQHFPQTMTNCSSKYKKFLTRALLIFPYGVCTQYYVDVDRDAGAQAATGENHSRDQAFGSQPSTSIKQRCADIEEGIEGNQQEQTTETEPQLQATVQGEAAVEGHTAVDTAEGNRQRAENKEEDIKMEGMNADISAQFSRFLAYIALV